MELIKNMRKEGRGATGKAKLFHEILACLTILAKLPTSLAIALS
jgi:hypothetical protein